MTTEYSITRDKKLSNPDSDLVKEIQVLRAEVKSIQKSVSIVLNRLPYVIHDELIHHECKCRVDDD